MSHCAGMVRVFCMAGLVSGLLIGAGCQKSNTAAPVVPPPVPVVSPPAPYYLDHAQPKLPTLKLWLGAHEITAEGAVTQTQIATGMMYRKEMGENEGMLFVFGRAHRAAFYMKNTYVPLSAAYIDSDGTILEIKDLKPLDETPVEAGTDRVQFVLEMNQGWFERHNVAPGAVIRTEYGRLMDAFIRYK